MDIEDVKCIEVVKWFLSYDDCKDDYDRFLFFECIWVEILFCKRYIWWLWVVICKSGCNGFIKVVKGI